MRSMRKSQTVARRRRRWAFDFDGTVCTFHGWRGQLVLGEPIPRMVARIKRLLAEGDEVFIYTARLNDDPALADAGNEATIAAIQAWCKLHVGQELPVHQKRMFERLYDDMAVQVVQNTGMTLKEVVVELLEEKLRAATDAGDATHALEWEDVLNRVDKL